MYRHEKKSACEHRDTVDWLTCAHGEWVSLESITTDTVKGPRSVDAITVISTMPLFKTLILI